MTVMVRFSIRLPTRHSTAAPTTSDRADVRYLRPNRSINTEQHRVRDQPPDDGIIALTCPPAGLIDQAG
jgi:hypothetical protein